MKIAFLSGKGGAGKTFMSVNTAVSLGATYLDCDVEEPNGRLFLRPEPVSEEKVYKTLPVFDKQKCTGCRKCVDFCHFNALVFLGSKPMVFPEVCHSCGGCALLCPSGAVSEEKKEVGHVEIGNRNGQKVVTGVLDLGEASAVPVINRVLEEADENTVIDCPPGSSCSVMEAVRDADYAVLVTEPTAFAFHNFMMVHELVSLLGVRCGVVINKAEEKYPPLMNYIEKNGLTLLAMMPFERETALSLSKGEVVVDKAGEMRERFSLFAGKLTEEAAR